MFHEEGRDEESVDGWGEAGAEYDKHKASESRPIAAESDGGVGAGWVGNDGVQLLRDALHLPFSY